MVKNAKDSPSSKPTGERRMLHTMFRVTDLASSVSFYTKVLGMRVLRKLDQPDDGYTLVFLGFDDESSSCVLELTYNYGVTHYDPGSAFGHIAISVEDCVKACTEIRVRGGKITLEPRVLKGTDETIAFASDPDGYQIELIQR